MQRHAFSVREGERPAQGDRLSPLARHRLIEALEGAHRHHQRKHLRVFPELRLEAVNPLPTPVDTHPEIRHGGNITAPPGDACQAILHDPALGPSDIG